MAVPSRTRPDRSRHLLTLLTLGCVLGTLAATGCHSPSPAGGTDGVEASETAAGRAANLRSFTGAPTRVVWVQGDGTDPTASGTNLVLMGFDTEDRRGERVILGEPGSYIKPLFISSGNRILFTRHSGDPADVAVFVVNWDGSGLEKVADGAALAAWQDPQTGRDWLYLGTHNSPEAPGNFDNVQRIRVDRPGARELVWNKTPVSGDTFQVSEDGRFAGGLFPWPHAGIAELPNGDLRIVGDGCWTAFRDAGVGLFWYFDGAHRNVTLVDREADQRWTVALNEAPGFDGAEVYHPRWANHPRFVAISGPYNQGGANQVRSGGAQAEIHIGRFSRDYSRIEAWARVTDNAAGDSYPDVWIDRAASPHPIDLVRAPRTQPESDPTPQQTIVVEARLAEAASIPSPRSIAPYRNALVVNVYDVIRVIEGEYDESRMLVAQWAIQDARVVDAARQRMRGSVAQLTLERYDARPELEGERLIAASGSPNLPLFYDVDSRP